MSKLSCTIATISKQTLRTTRTRKTSYDKQPGIAGCSSIELLPCTDWLYDWSTEHVEKRCPTIKATCNWKICVAIYSSIYKFHDDHDPFTFWKKRRVQSLCTIEFAGATTYMKKNAWYNYASPYKHLRVQHANHDEPKLLWTWNKKCTMTAKLDSYKLQACYRLFKIWQLGWCLQPTLIMHIHIYKRIIVIRRDY